MDGSTKGLGEIIEEAVTRLEFLRDSGIREIPVPDKTAAAPAAEPADETRQGVVELVPGEGPVRAPVAFIGGAPDEASMRGGRPFSEEGPEGELLSRMIEAMGLGRRSVYVTYAVKFPEEGRLSDEAATRCAEGLQDELRRVKPGLVVTLGPLAARVLLGKEEVEPLRGRFHDFFGVPLMPTHGPAAMLRDPGLKRPAWKDLRMVMERLDKGHSE